MARSHPLMSVDDALNVVRCASSDDQIDVAEIIAAGLALAAHVTALARELERHRARSIDHRATQRGPQAPGHELHQAIEVGGMRHFLHGEPVHAGQGLHLLTFVGWLAGRYEWSFRPGTLPLFFFSLPGVGEESCIRIPSAARLAWPTEVE